MKYIDQDKMEGQSLSRLWSKEETLRQSPQGLSLSSILCLMGRVTLYGIFRALKKKNPANSFPEIIDELYDEWHY